MAPFVNDTQRQRMHDLIERNSPRLEYLVRAGDILIVYTTGNVAALWCFSSTIAELSPVHGAVLYFCCALAAAVFPRFDLYSSWRGRSLLLMAGHTAMALLIVLATGVLFGFLIRQLGDLSRLWMIVWFLQSVTALVLSRILLYSALSGLRERGLNNKRVIIVGYGDTGRELHLRAMQQQWTGYNVVATYDSDGGKPLDNRIEALQSFDEISHAVIRHQAHEVWITLPLAESPKLRQLQSLLGNTLVDVRWVPDVAAISILSHRTVEFLGMPVVELNQAASNGMLGIAKEVFDRLFAAAVLLLLAPLFITIAIAIKLSSLGPVFFTQPRLGLNGRRFNVLKFRSMKLHLEHGKITQATKDDPRITPVGRFLRRTSLDELPQFFNVLMGDMSVVGPRPHALVHNDLYKNKLARYMQRHRVKPGITGWAQINGYRGETDTDEKMARRIQFDLYYIQHWSFWMDLKIIVWTAFKGWTNKNAY
jgi:putative colanic acid biosynthesis UDP-glucose lipid carrier transferase